MYNEDEEIRKSHAECDLMVRKMIKIDTLERVKLIMKELAKEKMLSTSAIGELLGVKTYEARLLILRMKDKGIVEKHIFSTKNVTIWKLAN